MQVTSDAKMPDWGAIAAKRDPNYSESPRATKRRADQTIRQAALNAFDILGNEQIFLELYRGAPEYKRLPPALAAKLLAEDRRCFVQVLMKLLPIEVAGSLDASLTVKVVTMVGDQEIDITPAKLIPKEPVATATSLSAPPDRARPESPRDHA